MKAPQPIVSLALLIALSACASNAERRAESRAGSEPTNLENSSPSSGTFAAERENAVSGLGIDAQNAQAASLATDLDSDQVPNELDQCPNSIPESAVDDTGCAVFSGAIPDLEFEPDDDQLDQKGRESLDKLVAAMQAYPDVVIAVDGHTDNRGLAGNNLDLSKRRVIAVVRYLVENGIPANRLKPYGYGESRPRKSNATEEGRRSNRRIEIREVGA